MMMGIRSRRLAPNNRWSLGAAPNMPGRHAPQKGHRSSATPMSLPQFGQIIEPSAGDMTRSISEALAEREAWGADGTRAFLTAPRRATDALAVKTPRRR